MNLVLQNGQPGRRQGLSRNINSSLLTSLNPSAVQTRATMPKVVTQKAALAQVPEKEEDIYRDPEDSDDESDKEWEKRSNENIVKTSFTSASQKADERKGKANVTAREGKKGAAVANGETPPNTRSRRGKISPVSSQSNDSPKRKVNEDGKALGAGMFDEHGRKKGKRAKTNTYAGRKTFVAPPKIKSDTDEETPKKSYKKGPSIEPPETPNVEQRTGFRRPNYSIDDSPTTTPPPPPKFRISAVGQSPDREESLHQPVLENTNGTLGNLIRKARFMLNTESIPRPPAPALLPIDDDEEDFQTMTQMAKCPMCGETVDPADLRAFGRMNTRKQEKFCRSHRKTAALDTWKAEEYPTIDWAKLDSRISKHHSFIKELINGADSYYRERLAETVNAGKNRSLLKSTYNPIPGYYGTRGLRVISENTMRKFTPLLKRRMVVDRLMAARGFTPYVEYVVVPEVAIKLIMEDMKCEANRAREIMSESLEVGELLSEEIKDVVARKGSEELEDSDE